MAESDKLDLTQCRLGQIVPLRDGREAIYLSRNDKAEPHFRHHLTVWSPFTCSDDGRVLPSGKTGADVIGAWDTYRLGGTLADFVFGISNDGGKTVVAVRNHVDDAMAYLDLQNRNGITDYAVVVIPKRKESKHE